MRSFAVGKLPTEVLAKLLAQNRIDDPRVIVGPQIGEDAAVIDFGDTCLVAKTDPITFATDRIGWYAVNINANDIATMGAAPKWFLATALLPEGQATEDLAQSIFSDLMSACSDLGISLCGGHTEITHGLDRPIIVGQMLGEVARDRLVVNSNAHPGDTIILTNGIATEGTAIIARERAAAVRERFGQELLDRARGFLYDPGISVVNAALAANAAGPISAMHDPTEGGLATGLLELAEAAGCGVEVDADRVHTWPECRALCEAFGLDPLGIIASGALLVVCSPARSDAVVQALQRAGVRATPIGHMTEAESGLRLRRNGKLGDLPRFDVDEITKLL